jgi:hypothetical protein
MAKDAPAPDQPGSLNLSPDPPVIELVTILSTEVHTQSAKMDWLKAFLAVSGAINMQNRYRGEIKFNLASIAPGNVVKATLYLSNTSGKPSGEVIVERLTSDPAATGKLYDASVGKEQEQAHAKSNGTGQYEWNVTDIVKQWLNKNAPAPNYGFRLRPNNDMNFPQTDFNQKLYDPKTNPNGPRLEISVS